MRCVTTHNISLEPHTAQCTYYGQVGSLLRQKQEEENEENEEEEKVKHGGSHVRETRGRRQRRLPTWFSNASSCIFFGKAEGFQLKTMKYIVDLHTNPTTFMLTYITYSTYLPITYLDYSHQLVDFLRKPFNKHSRYSTYINTYMYLHCYKLSY